MLHDRVEDLSYSQGATIWYLIGAVSKDTVQTTVTTLEGICARSVDYHRFTISCAVASVVQCPTDERILIASSLVKSAVTLRNAITLLGAALDDLQTPITLEDLTALMARDLKLSAAQQVTFATALALSSANGKAAATEFLQNYDFPKPLSKLEADVVQPSALLSYNLTSLHTARRPAAGVGESAALDVSRQESAGVVGCISMPEVLRELGTGCVTTMADSRELLSIFPQKFTEKDVSEVLGFFASQGTADNDSSTYVSLMSISGKSKLKNVSSNSGVVNAMPLLDALNVSNRGFDWDEVIRLLDQPHAEPFQPKNISVIFDAYHKFHHGGNYPSVSLFLSRWDNVARQRAALEYIIRHPEKVNRKTLSTDAPAELLPAIKPAGVTTAELELWRSYRFVEAAVHVASRSAEFDNEVLRPAVERMPLLFFYTLLFGSFEGTIKHLTTLRHLLSTRDPPLDLVSKHILPAAERHGRMEAVIGLFSELTVSSPARLIDVLEMVLTHKPAIKSFILKSGSPRLVVALAMCMDEAGEPSDKWLQRALEGKLRFRASATENRFSVAMSIVEVAAMLLAKQLYTSSSTAALTALVTSPLKDVLKDVVERARALLTSTDSLFPEDVENGATEFFKKMYAEGNTATALTVIESLLKSPEARDKQLFACIVSIMFEESSAISCYPRKELQLFAALYGQMIAKELLPPNQQQRAWGLLLPAIVKPSNYAMEEYGIIALAQIKSRLADWPHYGRALRHIKDLDFRVPGIMAAINRGIREEDLAKNPQICEKAESPISRNVLSSIDPAIVSAESKNITRERIAAATLHTLDIGTLLTSKSVTSPPRVIQEQINFLIGNTDVHNLDNNARELAQQLRPEYYEYFADYLVVKRAALEPNYHGMYIDLISKVRSKDLERALRVATISAVKRLLLSEKIRTDTSERILLRNLGSWLGSITLERSIPILQQDLNFKDLLYQGLREGKLMAVVSFITRVLTSCAKSGFFRIPNPWTMAQLCLLLEMYQLPHLRITLRFEVEVICKNLHVSLAEVDRYMCMHPSHAATQTRLIDIYKTIDIDESPDFNVVENESGLPDIPRDTPTNSQLPSSFQQQLRSSTKPLQASAEPFQPKDVLGMPNLQAILAQSDIPSRPPVVITEKNIKIAAEIQRLGVGALYPHRLLIATTFRTVIEDVYQNYALRSVNVAVLSTYSIVVKDFTRDPALEEMLLAGEAMSRSLATSLCFATSREVLPEELQKALTVALEQLGEPFNNPDVNATVCASLLESNLEFCMLALEYITGEEAAKALRSKLVDHLREKALAAATNEPLRIPQDQIDAAGLLIVMGETLVPVGRMPPAQKDVYADFFNCVPVVFQFNTALRGVEEAVSKHYAAEDYVVANLASLQFVSGAANEAHTLTVMRDRLLHLTTTIYTESAIYLVGPLLNKLLIVCATMEQLQKNTANTDANSEAAKSNARRSHIVNFLHQIYLYLLQRCGESGGEATRDELTRLYLKNDHRYSYLRLTTDLIRIKMIDCSRLDEDLAKTLATGSPSCVTYAGDIISMVIIKEKLISSKDMRRTLAALDTIARSRNVPRNQPAPAPSPSCVTTGPLSKAVDASVTNLVMPTTLFNESMSTMVRSLLDEWIAMWSRKSHHHSGEERNPSVDFVKSLQHHGMLDMANLAIFLGLSIRFCVEHYATTALAMEREQANLADGPLVATKPGAPPPHRLPYSAKLFTKCDGFIDLVLVLLRCCSLRCEPTRDQRAETTLLKRVLDMFYRVLANHHDCTVNKQLQSTELPPNTAYIPFFQQQPYVRLLSNLLITIQRQESSAHREISDDVTVAFQTVLHHLQPTEYPAFAFGWLELVSHRIFIPRCLRKTETWGRYTDLLADALAFVEFLCQGHAISPNGLVFYKALFKLMLILLHDYPQFLTSQHYPLCNAIPAYCVQMLNTVLCSFPQELRLPEPFQHVSNDNPDMMKPIDTTVQVRCIKATFAEYAKSGVDFTELDQYMIAEDQVLPERTMKMVFDHLCAAPRWTLMNAVVLHVAIVYLESHNGIPQTFPASNAMRLYRYLCHHFDTKHRYHFLCACANHLRYPNIQTNFFAKVIFNLFRGDRSTDPHVLVCTQEQITRVVAEKTVIVQPHPWGVLNTFVELMRNPEFHFWDLSFIHTPHLEGVFTKLKRTVDTRNSAQPQASQMSTVPASQS